MHGITGRHFAAFLHKMSFRIYSLERLCLMNYQSRSPRKRKRDFLLAYLWESGQNLKKRVRKKSTLKADIEVYRKMASRFRHFLFHTWKKYTALPVLEEYSWSRLDLLVGKNCLTGSSVVFPSPFPGYHLARRATISYRCAQGLSCAVNASKSLISKH